MLNTAASSRQSQALEYEGKYSLVCTKCGREYSSKHLKCSYDDGLLRSKYWKKQLALLNLPGMGRFHDWLPVKNPIPTKAGPITYKSEELAQELGLDNLYISFSGYWPERGARIKTCSFKELEAHPTLYRILENGDRGLVVASAGNTARAFAHVSVLSGVNVYLVVPESGYNRMWLPELPAETIHLILMEGKNDYTDAIHLADRIARLPGMMPEGGARNIARREGMGTCMLDGAFYMKRMPDHYFQAVGSGTGGISAWEASLRLLQDGRFGNKLPKLHLAQNLPFAPMYRAWRAGRRGIVEEADMPDPKKLIEAMYSNILSNREPPYSIPGGVYDALAATKGEMYGINNEEAKSAKRLFEELEGIDIVRPAGVAVAALLQALELGSIKREEFILLNITGGGFYRLIEEFSLTNIRPVARARDPEVSLEDILGDIIQQCDEQL